MIATASRRHRVQQRVGSGAVGFRGVVQELRDAEVEQLNGPLTRDQDVRRLQVPVDDEVLMRVVNGAAHPLEQAKAVFDREALAIAVLGDGQPGHVLHGEPWRAIAGDAAVQEPRDAVMLQRREDLPLRPEPADEVGRDECAANERSSLQQPYRGPVASLPITALAARRPFSPARTCW